jgi:uncharacterized protein
LSGGGFPRVFAGAGDRGVPKNLVLVLGVQRPESKHLMFSQLGPREPSYARGIMCWTAKPVIRHLAIKRSELNELCRKFRVRRLSAFGSALTERFDEEKSDLDFVVEFEPLPKGEHAKTYFGLIEALQGLFGRRVDLLEQDAIRNPYVKQEIDRTQQNLYGA